MTHPEQAHQISTTQPDIGLMTRLANVIRENPAATLAVTGVAALAGYGIKSPNVEAQGSAGDLISTKVWPSITQVIDGVEPRWQGSIGAEQLFADDCKDNSPFKIPVFKKLGSLVNPASHTLSTRVTMSSISGCDGYGRRTSQVWTEAKKPGSHKVQKGEKTVIRNNHAMDDTVKLEMPACKKGAKLLVRVGQRNRYLHLDGSTQSVTSTTKFQKVTC